MATIVAQGQVFAFGTEIKRIHVMQWSLTCRPIGEDPHRRHMGLVEKRLKS
jgi:hypothetical protein